MNSELVLQAHLLARWPKQRGKNNLADDFVQRQLGQQVRGECAFCHDSFVGTFSEEKLWWRGHKCDR